LLYAKDSDDIYLKCLSPQRNAQLNNTKKATDKNQWLYK